MFSGVLGVAPEGWQKKIQKILLRGAKPVKGRRGAGMLATDFTAEKEALEKRTGHVISKEDLLSYLLYPEVFVKFDKFRQAHSDVSVLPTPVFFYGLKSGEEITVEIEAGKTLILKFMTASQPHPARTRTLFFDFNGQPRRMTAHDKAVCPVESPHP